MVILPYIISGKVERLVTRNNINKKEFVKLTSSEIFERIEKKYRNEKIKNYIFSLIATILCSTFIIIDYEDDAIHGKTVPIQTLSNDVAEEICEYVELV